MERAIENGWDVRGVLNNDTVGDPYGPWPADTERGREARGLIRVFSQGIPVEATPEEYRRRFEQLCRKTLECMRESTETQLKEFQDVVTKWTELVTQATT